MKYVRTAGFLSPGDSTVGGDNGPRRRPNAVAELRRGG